MVKGKVNRERAMRREDIGQEMKMKKNKLRIITDQQEYLAGKTCSQNRTDEKLFYRCVSFFFPKSPPHEVDTCDIIGTMRQMEALGTPPHQPICMSQLCVWLLPVNAR